MEKVCSDDVSQPLVDFNGKGCVVVTEQDGTPPPILSSVAAGAPAAGPPAVHNTTLKSSTSPGLASVAGSR